MPSLCRCELHKFKTCYKDAISSHLHLVLSPVHNRHSNNISQFHVLCSSLHDTNSNLFMWYCFLKCGDTANSFAVPYASMYIIYLSCGGDH